MPILSLESKITDSTEEQFEANDSAAILPNGNVLPRRTPISDVIKHRDSESFNRSRKDCELKPANTTL